MRIVCIADTHGSHRQVDLPEGDVLVHAGDFCLEGDYTEAYDFIDWADQKRQFGAIVLVAGNHDECLEPGHPDRSVVLEYIESVPDLLYLQDETVTIEGVDFYGTPWTPTFQNWSFMKDEEGLRDHFEAIPASTDVLVSHGPPRDILDTAITYKRAQVGLYKSIIEQRKSAGSTALREAVDRVQPSVHVFGHIHEATGERTVDGGQFVNASIVDEDLDVERKPRVIEL